LISVRSEVQILPGPPSWRQEPGARNQAPRTGRHGLGATDWAPRTGRHGLGAKISFPGFCPRSAFLSAGACTGGVAQLGERLLCKQEVIGSIPFTSTRRRCHSAAVPAASAPVPIWCRSGAGLAAGGCGGRRSEKKRLVPEWPAVVPGVPATAWPAGDMAGRRRGRG
jgi:hypothetical protein